MQAGAAFRISKSLPPFSAFSPRCPLSLALRGHPKWTVFLLHRRCPLCLRFHLATVTPSKWIACLLLADAGKQAAWQLPGGGIDWRMSGSEMNWRTALGWWTWAGSCGCQRQRVSRPWAAWCPSSAHESSLSPDSVPYPPFPVLLDKHPLVFDTLPGYLVSGSSRHLHLWTVLRDTELFSLSMLIYHDSDNGPYFCTKYVKEVTQLEKDVKFSVVKKQVSRRKKKKNQTRISIASSTKLSHSVLL